MKRTLGVMPVTEKNTSPVDIYNKYVDKITCAFKKDIYDDENGNSRCKAKRTKERDKYVFKGFKRDESDNIVLIECPEDVLAIEFEAHSTVKNDVSVSSREDRDRWIQETAEKAKNYELNSCVAGHGGTSDYLYLFNLDGLPLEGTLEAKKHIVTKIVPTSAIPFVDWTNIGKTLIPVIGRQHWKSKYKGAVHKILSGEHPTKHLNKVTKLLTDFKKPTQKQLQENILTTTIKERVKLKDLMEEFGYDMTKNPTMCMLGHESSGKACFSYDVEKDVYHCFSCGAGGDVISFIEDHKKIPFNDALKFLRDRANVCKEELIAQFDTYELTKSIFGYMFSKITYSRDGAPKRVEMATFNNITRQETCFINPFERTTTLTNQIEFKIKGEIVYATEESEIIEQLWKGRRAFCNDIKREDEIAFYNVVTSLPTQKVNATNAFGFYDGAYHDYPEYTSYNLSMKKHGNSYAYEKQITVPNEQYVEFITCEYDKNIVDEIIDILNDRFPRNDEERLYHKTILSFAISSALKIELLKSGVQLHPYLIVLGAKEMGKTTACKILCSSLFNTSDLSIEHFQGSKGARLKHINNDVFPLLVDELTDLSRWENDLNAATSKGYIEIVKGTQDGSVETQQKYFNLVIPTNSFKTKSSAFRSRLIMFDYSHRGNSADKRKIKEDIVFLEDNMHHLGKYIYSKFKDFDIQNMVKKVADTYKELGKRDVDKITYVMVGEMILDSLGINIKTKLDASLFVGNDEERESTNKSDIINILRDRMNTTFRDREGNVYSCFDIINIAKEDNGLQRLMMLNFNSAINFFKSNGILFKYNAKDVYLSKNIIPFVNKEMLRLRYNKTYTTMKSLAEDLDITSDFTLVRTAKSIELNDSAVVVKDSSARAIKIDKIKEFFVEEDLLTTFESKHIE